MLEFAKSQPFTLGVEVELQIVDRESHDLLAKASTLLARWSGPPRVQPEIFQSMLEIATGVCEDAEAAEIDLRRTAVALGALARTQGVRFIATGTHPTARYQERKLFPADRYHGLIARNQWIARRLLIFGLHVHIGMPDPDRCIAVQNELLYELGLLLAASTSSPFWQGEVTGLASSRVTVFEALPTGGSPSLVNDWAEFSGLVDTLTRANAITSVKDLWWDIRPSPRYGTLEIRVCDGIATLSETAALVALMQALARQADARISAGRARGLPPIWLIRENKWRASRHGMDADLLIDAQGTLRSARAHLAHTLDSLAAEGLLVGPERYWTRLRRLANGAPTSADRQKAVFEQTNDFGAVTRTLADEWENDVLTGITAD